MIDVPTYEIYARKKRLGSGILVNKSEQVIKREDEDITAEVMAHGRFPDNLMILVFPNQIIGYNLRRKAWRKPEAIS